MPQVIRNTLQDLKRCLAVLAVAAAFSHSLLSAEPPDPFVISHFGSGNGLPQNSVNAITQTEDGYLWFGTFNGLVRFDGLSFDVFSERNTEGLISARVGLLAALGNEVFVGGYQDLRRFSSDDSPASSASELPGAGRLLRLASNAENALYFLREGEGVVGYSAEGPAIIGLPNGFESPDVVGLQPDRQGGLWLASTQRLFRYAEGNWSAIALPTLRNNEELRGLFQADNDGGPLLLTDTLLLQYTQAGWAQLAILNAELTPQVQQLILEEDGRLWLAGDAIGLHTLMLSEPNQPLSQVRGLESNTVTALHKDHEGGLWVGTRNAGVHRIRDRSVFSYRAPEELRRDITTAVIEDLDGSILYGSRGGGLFRLVEDEVRLDSHLDKGITSLLRDSRNRLWLGTSNGQLWRRDSLHASWQRLPLNLSSVDKRIFAITEISDDEIWLAVQDGVVRYESDGESLITEEEGLIGTYVRDILQDSQGQIWIGTQESGLSRLSDGSFSDFTQAQGLASNDAWHLYEDADSIVWVGSFGSGLSRIEGDRIRSFTSVEGLPDNIIAAIHSDPQGRLWLGSAKGLFYLSEQSLNELAQQDSTRIKSRLLGSESGAGHDEITGGYRQNVLLDSSGQLWFTTQTGVLRVDPELVVSTQAVPRPFVSQLSVDGRPFAAASSGEYELPPGGENISLDFTAPSFESASQLEFRYRLEGYDSAWIEAGSFRRAIYSHLPPGRYKFALSARNADGIWSSVETSVGLNVAPFFWQTPAFRVALTVLILALVAAAAYWLNLLRFRRRLSALERERSLNDERIRIARDLHDELGAGLTHLHLLSENGPVDSGREQLRSPIGSKARELVRSLDEIVWSIDPRRDNLQSLFDYIMNYSESFLGAAGVRCLIDDLPEAVEGIADSKQRHQLLLCVKEVLNNAVKYSGCSKVTLACNVGDDSCCVNIVDDGQGFDTAVENSLGNGLNNLHQRMETIGGSCEINSTIGVGTSVQLRWNM